MLYLTTIRAAQADYPSDFATVYKRHVVQDRGFGASAIIRISLYSNRSSTHTSADSQSSSPAKAKDTPCFVLFAASLVGSNSIRMLYCSYSKRGLSKRTERVRLLHGKYFANYSLMTYVASSGRTGRENHRGRRKPSGPGAGRAFSNHSR